MDEWKPRIVIHDDPQPVWLGAPKPRGRWRALSNGLAAAASPVAAGMRFLTLGIAPVAALVFVGWVVVSEIGSKRIEIAPIAVPQQFLAVGFTPEIMSRRLLDQITIIQKQSQSHHGLVGGGAGRRSR